jgi:hypothetical protein
LSYQVSGIRFQVTGFTLYLKPETSY